MELFKKLLNYYNHIRYRVVSLFYNDPYSLKIKSLERKIDQLRQQKQVAPVKIKFSDEFSIDKRDCNIEIFQSAIPIDNLQNLVNLRRERVQLCNMVGDYIGDYNAVKNQDKEKAQSIYDHITAIETDRLDAKTSKKLKDFMSKIKVWNRKLL